MSVSAHAQGYCNPEVDPALEELTRVVTRSDEILRTELGQDWCSPLAVGAMRAVDLSWNQSPTGVQMRYNLARTTEDTYTASVALNYVPDPNPANAPSIGASEMLEATRRCLENDSSLFETPSGKKLRIQILSNTEAQSSRFNESNRPPVVDINLGRTGGNAASHGQDLDCATRTHEILHLMGLVDEYDHAENGTSNQADLACKPIARSANIMTNHTSSVVDTFGGSSRKRERGCVCKDGAESCRLALRRNNENLFYYMYAKFSPAQATRLGYRCRKEESPIGSAVSLTATSSIPAPVLTPTQTGFIARSYEFRESDRTLRGVQVSCDCSNPAGCTVGSSNFLDALYRVDTNACPADMNDRNGFFSVYAITDSADEFGASRIRRNPYAEDLVSFAVNKPFDGLKEYQLKRIIDGGCQGITDSYTQCSSYASRIWNGSLDDPGCSQRPRDCYEEE